MEICAFEIKILPFILGFLLSTVNEAFNLEPSVTEALIGESTYFDCTTTTHTNEVHWYHYRVGAKDHEDICLYCLGKVHTQYENKIKIERIGTDTCRLRIKSVQWEDAGKYICQDNGGIGDSVEAQLVVLEYAPICQTTLKPDGLLGSNSCNMEPDELEMFCNVLYHGDIPPIIQWRDVRSETPIWKGVFCRRTGYEIASKLVMDVSVGLHGSSYVCEVASATTRRYNCSSGEISVIHVNTNNKVSEMVLGSTQKVICFADSSQPCSHTWKWLNGEHEEIVTNDAALTPSKVGLYKCESECNIRGKQCTVSSGLVYVSEQTTQYLSNEWGMFDRILLTALIVVIVLFVLGCIIVCFIVKRLRRNRSKFPNCSKDKNIQEQQQLLKDNSQNERPYSRDRRLLNTL